MKISLMKECGVFAITGLALPNINTTTVCAWPVASEMFEVILSVGNFEQRGKIMSSQPENNFLFGFLPSYHQLLLFHIATAGTGNVNNIVYCTNLRSKGSLSNWEVLGFLRRSILSLWEIQLNVPLKRKESKFNLEY